MPLRDHFHSPVKDRHTWDSLHSMWPGTIVRQLFDILPVGYVSAPSVYFGKFSSSHFILSVIPRQTPPKPTAR
jgi:hypothetical protein